LVVVVDFVQDPADSQSWDREINARTRLVWVETPSNPTLFVTDIAAVADVAHARGVPLLVDNTTATAALQKPLELGADIILLSITKFLCGNGSVLGGSIVGPKALVEDIRWNTTEFVGAIMQPFEAWLTLQFLETLSLPRNSSRLFLSERRPLGGWGGLPHAGSRSGTRSRGPRDHPPGDRPAGRIYL